MGVVFSKAFFWKYSQSGENEFSNMKDNSVSKNLICHSVDQGSVHVEPFCEHGNALYLCCPNKMATSHKWLFTFKLTKIQ